MLQNDWLLDLDPEELRTELDHLTGDVSSTLADFYLKCVANTSLSQAEDNYQTWAEIADLLWQLYEKCKHAIRDQERSTPDE